VPSLAVASPAADARDEEARGPVVLKVAVEIATGRNETILVHESDSAPGLAEEFCERHSLPASLAVPLAKHIQDNMRKSAPKGGTSGASTPCAMNGAGRTPVAAAAEAALGTAGVPSLEASCSKSTNGGQPAPAPATAAANGSGRRCDRLHEDARQRKVRMERLRQQACPPPRNTGSAAGCHRSAEEDPEADSPGSRLHRDHAQRQLKIKLLQAEQAEQRRREEAQLTFQPTIHASQRTWQGVSRSLRETDGSRKKSKIELLREQQQISEMDGCTFKPEIDQKSQALMEERLARLKITGSLYDALSGDALRRKERQFEAECALPPGVTFQPDLGGDQYRPSVMNAGSRQDSFNRLAYSKSCSDKWQMICRQRQDDDKPQADFRPQTGRAPLVERNRAGLPIGDFLYESGREKAAAQEEALLTDRSHSASSRSAPQMTKASRQVFEDTKKRRYRELYDSLASNDPQQCLRAATLTLQGLDEEVAEFLTPMVAYLRETGSQLEFEPFCAALDYQRTHTVTPTALLFVQRGSARRSSSGHRECDDEITFSPRIDPESNRLADKRRSRSAPLYDQLILERDMREARMCARRQLVEEKELLECTFRPNSSRRSSSAGRPRSAGTTRSQIVASSARQQRPRSAGCADRLPKHRPEAGSFTWIARRTSLWGQAPAAAGRPIDRRRDGTSLSPPQHDVDPERQLVALTSGEPLSPDQQQQQQQPASSRSSNSPQNPPTGLTARPGAVAERYSLWQHHHHQTVIAVARLATAHEAAAAQR